MVADNLNGVFVCADCAVGTETPEFAVDCSVAFGYAYFLAYGQGKICNVIDNTYCKMVLRLICGKVFVNGKYLRRRNVL